MSRRVPVRRSWPVEHYNDVVKVIERASDNLRAVVRALGDCTGDTVALRIVEKMKVSIDHLDKQALRCLALYDEAAREMVKQKLTYDPRRDMFKAEFEKVCK